MAKYYKCNMCGKAMDEYDLNNGSTIYQRLCYGSKYDGENIAIDLCCNCIDALIDSCSISPIVCKPTLAVF